VGDEQQNIPAGAVLASRYRVVRHLGEGGMGSVLLVQHVATDEHFALKVLHPSIVRDASNLERFRREARTPARIDSDHVARVTDADVAPELGGRPFLVMEYLRGEDLEHAVERRGPLPPAEVVLYLRQTARALDKAHAIGIVHRDLKPENLFLTQREDGSPLIKLLDFGIAKLTGASKDLGGEASKTSTGQIFGTPLYMAPEQVKAESDRISARTDVWALGLIAHKLLTGEDFWQANTITHLIAQIAYEPMKPPSSRGGTLGSDYDAWLLKCCAKEPDDRFASAGAAVSALANVLSVSELAPPSSVLPEQALPSSGAPATLVSGALSPVSSRREASTVAFAATSIQEAPPKPEAKPEEKRSSRGMLVVAAGLVAVAGGITLWRLYGSSPSQAGQAGPTSPPTTIVSVVATGPVVTLASAPSPEPTTSAQPSATQPSTAPSAKPSAAPVSSPTATVAATTATTATPKPTSAPTTAPSTKPSATAAPTAAPVPTPAPTPIDPLSQRQ
jgi:serine/threonine protein kinase